jgi:hypothetical protein
LQATIQVEVDRFLELKREKEKKEVEFTSSFNNLQLEYDLHQKSSKEKEEELNKTIQSLQVEISTLKQHNEFSASDLQKEVDSLKDALQTSNALHIISSPIFVEELALTEEQEYHNNSKQQLHELQVTHYFKYKYNTH